MLAAEPLCLCGVDVAAPDTARGQKQTLRGIKESYRDVLTPKEVRLTACSIAAACDPAAAPERLQHARSGLL